MFNIAFNTFREIMRNKFLSLLLFLSIVLILASTVLDTLSMGQTERVLTDFGLSFIEITGLFIILLLGGGMMTREIEGRTIYLLLSKPIRRGAIIYGKFVGFSLVLLLLVLLETFLVFGLISFHGFTISALFFIAVIGIYLKLLSILALLLFFSTFVSSAVALFMAVASYIIGHSGYVMLSYAISDTTNPMFLFLARSILAIFPNLEALNFKNYVATDAIIPENMYLLGFLIGIPYILIVLFLSAKVFEKKSFDAV